MLSIVIRFFKRLVFRCDRMFLYLFLSYYAMIKNAFGIPKGALSQKPWYSRVALQAFLILLAVLALIIQELIFLPGRVMHFLVDVYLRVTIGEDYDGLLLGQDAQVESSSETITINVVVILNGPKNPDEIVRKMVNLGQSFHESVYKLSNTVKTCLGYPYYVKNCNMGEDCTEVVRISDEEYITKEQFMDHIQKHHLDHGFAIGAKVWYGKMFSQPIRWNKKSETTNQYAVIMVFRHCLADGVALIGMLKNFMIRETNPDLMKITPTYREKPNVSLDNLYTYNNPFTAKHDKVNLEIKGGSSRQLALYIEEEIKYVPIVKMLKRKLKVGFTEILIAALTASLNEYALKRGKRIDTQTLAVIFRPINDDLESIINGTYNYDKLTNDSSVGVLKVPVCMKEGSTMVDRIRIINGEIDQIKHAIDGLLIYSLSQMGHLLPAPALRYATHFFTDRVTSGVTNVGGLKGGTIVGFDVETAFSFIPCYFKTAFRLSVFTKGDCFMLALVAKENNVYNRDELQEVLNNMFKYIDQLQEDVRNM